MAQAEIGETIKFLYVTMEEALQARNNNAEMLKTIEMHILEFSEQ